MTTQRVLTVLTVANLGILVFLLLSQSHSVQASGIPDELRAHSLVIVDAQGKERATIQIVPAGPARRADGYVVNDGKTYPETVRFRLIRPDGRPSVKITTTEEGSGLTLGGGVDPTYIVLDSNGGNPSIALTNKSGQRKTIKP